MYKFKSSLKILQSQKHWQIAFVSSQPLVRICDVAKGRILLRQTFPFYDIQNLLVTHKPLIRIMTIYCHDRLINRKQIE